jgi:hypothetical protein
MQPPRVPALLDAENRLRREWLAFASVWQKTAETWKDARRNQFENQHLKELPGLLSRTTAELTAHRELVMKASRALSDNPES